MTNIDQLVDEITRSGEELAKIIESAAIRADKLRIKGNTKEFNEANELYYYASQVDTQRRNILIKLIDDSQEMKDAIAAFTKVNNELKKEADKIKKIKNGLDNARKFLDQLKNLLDTIS